jgi:hypothetical protein
VKASRRRHTDQQGSALIIALLFITTFSVIVAALLSFSEVGLRAATTLKNQRDASYAADGAVDAAINRYSGGGACDDYAAPAVNGQSTIVRCAANGAAGNTKPENTLLSLGSDPSEGTRTTTGMRVFGNIDSNSTVTAGGTLLVQGKVSAVGTCTGPIQTAPPVPLQCAVPPVPGAAAAKDPDYAKAATVVPPLQAVPACGALVTLVPGYYDDAAALTALTGGGCPNATVWLQPGDYYLDFSFRSGGDATWTVDDPTVTVVGGTPRDPAAPPPAHPAVPGSCRTDTDAAPNDGVQVVMGGQSHLTVDRGKVELCARPSTTDQEIALYGLPPDRPSHTLVPTALGVVSGFANPKRAEIVGETPVAEASATAALGAPGPGSASLQLSSFRQPVPDGSKVDTVTLRVRHQDDGQMDPPTVTVGGDTCGAHGLTLRPGTMFEDTVDLTACGLASPAALAAMTVTYDAALSTGGTSATATLDGIAVDVAYREPVTRKPTTVLGSANFSAPDKALEIGEQPTPLTADATLAASPGPTSASITLAGLGDPPIPPGSTIDSAVLRVSHQDLGDVATPAVSVVFGDGSACTGQTLGIAVHATLADDRFDLACNGPVTPAKLAGMTATYVVGFTTGGVNATDKLDGMAVELVYRPPALTRPAATVTPTVFANPDAAKVVGETPTPLTADATLAGAGPTSASLAFAGFDQATPVPPAGSVVDSAILRIVHQDVGEMDPAAAVTVTVAGPVTPNPCTTSFGPASAGLFEDQIDLRSKCGFTTTDQLTGLTVTYTANLKPGGTTGTDHVDGVVLDVAYRPPAVFTAQTASGTGFNSLDNGKIIGEQPGPLVADAPFTPGGSTSASLTDVFAPLVPLPPGSVIDSASLRVAHQDDPGVGPVSVLPQFTGATCTTPVTLPLHPAAIAQDRVDLMAACGLGPKDQDKLASVTAAYSAVLSTATATRPAATASSSGFAACAAPPPAGGCPDDAKAIDGATADAALDATTAPTASIALGGYDATLPPGAVLSSAKLRIAHQDDPGVGPVTVDATWTGATGGSGGSCSMVLPAQPTIGVDVLDLRAAAPTCTPAAATDFTGLTVTYTAAIASGTGTDRLDGVVLDLAYQAPATDRLDGIALDVVYRPPAFEPLAGSLTNVGYTGAPCPTPPVPADAKCALVKVAPASADSATRFVVNGTVYAPSAPVDISMNGVDSQVLTRGVVARSIRLGIKAKTTNPPFQRPTVGVPPETLLFTAYPDIQRRAATSASTQFVLCTTTPPPPGGCPENAKAIDGESADADLAPAPGNTSAALTLDGWDAAAVPSGAAIDDVVLRVAHREEGPAGNVTVTAKVNGVVCADETLPVDATDGTAEDQVDLKNCNLADPAQLANLIVTYGVDLTSDPCTTPPPPPQPPPPCATDHLDGMTLDVLAGPLLRASVTFNGPTAAIGQWSTQP